MKKRKQKPLKRRKTWSVMAPGKVYLKCTENRVKKIVIDLAYHGVSSSDILVMEES